MLTLKLIMYLSNIDEELKSAAFEYFYWFSRFEFALKENLYLKSARNGANAEPNWNMFADSFSQKYVASPQAMKLIELRPKRQIVSENKELLWKTVDLSRCNNDLCKVVIAVKTVRNNLFHGGKHGDAEADSKSRNIELLKLGKIVLDQLAKLAEIECDYTRLY